MSYEVVQTESINYATLQQVNQCEPELNTETWKARSGVVDAL